MIYRFKNRLMKKLLFILFILPSWLISQDSTYTTRLYVEVKDTCETAYREYWGDWYRDGFDITREVKRDSIGIDSFKLIRYLWIDPKGQVVYSSMEEKQYKGKRKGSSKLFTGL